MGRPLKVFCEKHQCRKRLRFLPSRSCRVSRCPMCKREHYLQYRQKHLDQMRDAQKKSRSTPEYRAIQREQSKCRYQSSAIRRAQVKARAARAIREGREMLKDGYIKSTIIGHDKTLRHHMVPRELVNLQRARLQLHRKLKEISK